MDKSFDPMSYPQAFMVPKWLSDMPHWHRHIPFAAALVGILDPHVYVELGAFKGDSYAAICQAVDELDLRARCYAVDTWRGDGHVGVYSDEIYLALSRFNTINFSRFSTLMRMSFDEALGHFSDGSIDLLHIDGFHTEEAVAHDFETWKDKLSDRSIVLFHDINSRLPDFGAWKVWERLSAIYPHFEFPYGHGLGVLGTGTKFPAAIKALFEASQAQRLQIVRFYHALGERVYFLGQTKNAAGSLPPEVVQRELLTAGVAELAARYGHAESERKRIENALGAEAEERRRLEARGVTLDTERARLESQVVELDLRCDRLDTAEQERQRLDAKANALDIERLRLESQVVELDLRCAHLDTAEQERQRLDAKANALDIERLRLESQVVELDRRRARLETQVVQINQAWTKEQQDRGGDSNRALQNAQRAAAINAQLRDDLDRAVRSLRTVQNECDRLNERLVVLDDDVNALSRQGNALRETIAEIYGSRSWRVTRGLRWIGRIARGTTTKPVVVKAEAMAPGASQSSITDSQVKAIAFLLPQFHPIAENDAWWGKGFTEWRNVVQARPNFVDHDQPHLPADLGFYDLRVAQTRDAQAELAKRYGIHGFCYYYYWFNGKRLLHEPLDAMLESGKPDFPFCVCWANEGWTRTWDGAESDTLIAQHHSMDDSRNFIRALFRYFRDPRYIRVDGAPLLAVYRVGLIPDIRATASMWRDECRAAGLGEIHLVAVQGFGLIDNPGDFGFDAAIEFPPHGTDMAWNVNRSYDGKIVNPEFRGHIVDIDKVISVSLDRPVPDYVLYRGVMPRWDNTARRQDNPLIFSGTTPGRYERWLKAIVDYSCRVHEDPDRRLVFINAWNEWAEGAHLEPDIAFGHAYLEATRRALSAHPSSDNSDFSQPDSLDSVPVPASSQIGPNDGVRLSAPKRTFLSIAHALYRAVPIESPTKMRIAHAGFQYFGPLFHGSAAYANWQARNLRALTPPVPVPVPVPAEVPGTSPEDRARALAFRFDPDPIVSIIIPVFNKVDYTLQCLASIQNNLPAVSFEILMVDDCSTDATAHLLGLVQGIRVIRNEINLGFLTNCNNAAASSKAQYLMFLNNDTEVAPRWLDELVETLEGDPTIGMVGSKLLFADGMLQEAGGIIWNDGSGLNYGRGDDPRRPEYNYVRDVDYCSGASILIARKLFDRLGTFDKRYAPAYYEDTDLAFAVRKAGLRVVYQPFSEIVHHEGITSGTDLNRGVKAFQVVNQHKFFEKWAPVLRTFGRPGQKLELARERRRTKHALVIDVVTPLPDQDSGSIDTLNYMRLLLALEYKVTFLPDQLPHHGRYTEDLQRLGIETLYEPYIESGKAFLEGHGERFDLVLLHRAPYASKYIDDVRRCCSKADIIFNTVDLHFLREMRHAELEGSKLLSRMAEYTKAMEISVMQRADATIVISEQERELLQSECPRVRTYAIPYVRELVGARHGFAARRDIAFIGGFRHKPNIDALEYFVGQIWPQIRAELPDAQFVIVGSNAPDEVTDLAQHPGVVMRGFVPDLATVFDRIRLSVAPLRYGAGIKGKVGTSLCYGVPCVLTTVASEGMRLTNNVDALIADDPGAFAKEVVRAYTDEALWKKMSDNGGLLMTRYYSFKQAQEKLERVIEELDLAKAEPLPALALQA